MSHFAVVSHTSQPRYEFLFLLSKWMSTAFSHIPNFLVLITSRSPLIFLSDGTNFLFSLVAVDIHLLRLHAPYTSSSHHAPFIHVS